MSDIKDAIIRKFLWTNKFESESNRVMWFRRLLPWILRWNVTAIILLLWVSVAYGYMWQTNQQNEETGARFAKGFSIEIQIRWNFFALSPPC